jgi:glutaredoxin 3
MKFTIYSKPRCTFCDQAKALLDARSMIYEELILDVGQDKDPLKTYVQLATLKERMPTARTVPQIFNGETYIGGFTELRQLLN